jgi:hypothetical protein
MPEASGFAFTISPRQKELMELCRHAKFVLASGPRYSTKTVGCLHCVADHAWRTDRGNIAMVSVSQSAGLDSGVWEDLVGVIIPQWIASGCGMKWVKKPFTANVTKKPTCIVSNQHGTQTKIQLDSLKHEHEVEARFKNKRYSMMYVTELSNFVKRKTYDIWGECLRMLHLKEEDHLFLADTNPGDEGEDSWIYFVWYVMLKMDYKDYVNSCRKYEMPILEQRAFEVRKKSHALLEFTIDDNIFASQQRIDELIARYSHDKDLYDRYILGLWRKSSSDSLFGGVFRSWHVVGEIETPGNPDPVILLPQDSAFELITGWDPGAGTNSAVVFIEKAFQSVKRNGKPELLQSVFKAIDEIVIIGEDHSLEEFTEDVMTKMRWWEERMGRPFRWRHWSDRSVFDMKEPRANRYYYQIIHAASNGEITLTAADRGPGSVRQRVELSRKLLFENRAFFSNDKCPKLIEMFRSIRKGTSENQAIQRGSKHKHVHDAWGYAVGSEAWEEMETLAFNTARSSLKQSGSDEDKTLFVPM